jgi:hypothetical protein
LNSNWKPISLIGFARLRDANSTASFSVIWVE